MEPITTGEAEKFIAAAAAMTNVEPARVHGFLLIVHTHPESGECGHHMEIVTNVSPGMARTFAISYAERVRFEL